MIYKLLTALLLGVVLGIILWEKIGVGDQYRAYIRNLKQKGRDNAQQDVVFKPVLSPNSKSNSKPPLRERIAENKKKRKARRANRKG